MACSGSGGAALGDIGEEGEGERDEEMLGFANKREEKGKPILAPKRGHFGGAKDIASKTLPF